MEIWLQSILSTEAPAGNFEAHERSCDSLEAEALEAVRQNRKVLIESSQRIRNILKVLQTYADTPIKENDFRFTRVTRTNHEKARTNFRYGIHYPQISTQTANLLRMEEIASDENINDQDTVELNDLADLVKKFINDMATGDAPLVLSASKTISTEDFIKDVDAFNKAVHESSHPFLMDQCTKEKNNLSKLKNANQARKLCRELLPSLLLDCDNCYKAQLRDFIDTQAKKTKAYKAENLYDLLYN